MSGAIYIKCNKCGKQSKLPFSSMGRLICECGANDFLMDANSRIDRKPSWWVEPNDQQEVGQ